MEIGFDWKSQSVNEDVGSALVCLGIRQPSGHGDPILNTDYCINFETRAENGMFSAALIHCADAVNLSPLASSKQP